MQALFNMSNCALIRDRGYVLLDFGKELSGGIAIVTQNVSNENAKYRIVFGESVSEALSKPGEKNSGNFHSIRDMTVDAVFMSTQTFGETGFRFVKIEAVGGDVTVGTVKAVPNIRELEYKGSFRCNDELLNKIWETGAYTVHLNMHEYLWDGIKRDRLVWSGDMHPSASTVYAVFGDDVCVKNSLDLIKQETPCGGWMNGIPTYSLWWIINQHDRYMRLGDLNYLKEQQAFMIELADLVIKWIDGDFSGKDKDNLFVDWSSAGQSCEIEGVKSIACIALKCLKKLFGILNEREYADKCSKYYELLLEQKAADDIELNNRIAALTVISGRNSEKATEKLLSTTENEMSCFMGYYILNALAGVGRCDTALDLIRKYWGKMLELGATSFWEEFKTEWAKNASRIDEPLQEGRDDIHGDFGEHCYKQYRLSLCHGWAGGPTAFLSERIGGIEILEPGCRKLRIVPDMGNLQWIDIKYPTPYGIVRIQSRKENGQIKTKITVPDGIEIAE
ncbi:MAG: alpha-L-rhamnosidase C-terminal domain-containing protein [Candidatus Ornithomonoglobus sp.]